MRQPESPPWCSSPRANWPCKWRISTTPCAGSAWRPRLWWWEACRKRTQLTALRKGARLVVATPGRLEDFLGRKLINFRALRILILDEADRMVDMGFLPAIRRIVATLPKERQTMCFSATHGSRGGAPRQRLPCETPCGWPSGQRSSPRRTCASRPSKLPMTANRKSCSACSPARRAAAWSSRAPSAEPSGWPRP